MTDPNGVRFPGAQQRFVDPRIPRQTLSPSVGGPIPSLPAARQDSLNMAPAAHSTRRQAYADAKRQLQDNPSAIMYAMRESLGVRDAMNALGQNVDQNLLTGNVRASPVNVYVQLVILPPNADTEQQNSALEFSKAIASPGPVPATTLASPFLAGDNYNTLVIVQGSGEAVNLPIPANSLVVVDEIDITSFDEMAEDEVLFGLGHANAQLNSNTTLNNTSRQLIAMLKGWPFGDAKLHGSSRLAPQRGPMGQQTRLVLACQFRSVGDANFYKPTFHYFEIGMRGWRLSIGQDLLPLNSLVSGDDQESG